MASHVLSVSARIPAPADRLYGILADYREGHPSILPCPPFVSLEVEEGGVGAGTVIRVEMRVLGRLQAFRAEVTEPQPGRVLVETNDTGYVTTFTVEPVEPGGDGAEGGVTLVTIATDRPGAAGLLAALERRLVARVLRPVYERELELLGAAVGAAQDAA